MTDISIANLNNDAHGHYLKKSKARQSSNIDYKAEEVLTPTWKLFQLCLEVPKRKSFGARLNSQNLSHFCPILILCTSIGKTKLFSFHCKDKSCSIDIYRNSELPFIIYC